MALHACFKSIPLPSKIRKKPIGYSVKRFVSSWVHVHPISPFVKEILTPISIGSLHSRKYQEGT